MFVLLLMFYVVKFNVIGVKLVCKILGVVFG